MLTESPACGSALLLLGKDAFAYGYLIDLVLRGALGALRAMQKPVSRNTAR